MSKRIHFTAWGAGVNNLRLPAYVLDDGYSPRAGLIFNAIARKNGLSASTVCGEGQSMSKGEVAEYHFSCTLGNRVKGGGMTPRYKVYIAIPPRGE